MTVREGKYGKMLDGIETYCGSIAGKRVLEVGSDGRGTLAHDIAEQLRPAVIYGVNPVLKESSTSGIVNLLKEDARALPFEDASIDVAVSLAVFEHVFELDRALEEIYRVLVPGGLLYTIFGPIWSGCWGHHLWVTHDKRTYSYVNTELPPFCHLLLSRDELANSFEADFDPVCLNKILDFVYDSPEQNRLFFSDYLEIASASPFTQLFNYGSVNIPYKGRYTPDNYAELFSNLVARYPDKSGFEFNSVFWLLQKPVSA